MKATTGEPKKQFFFDDKKIKKTSAKVRDKINKNETDKLNKHVEKSVQITAMPHPENGLVYAKTLVIENKTESGIILPEFTAHATRADMKNNAESSYNPRPLIVEVIDFADDLIRIKNLKKGDYLMLDQSFAESPVRVGEHTFIIVHETNIRGTWRN